MGCDSTEWLRSDPRRTAVGLDLDLEALQWCLENNIDKIGSDAYSRISLFHGNVLRPVEAKLVKHDEPEELISSVSLEEEAEEKAAELSQPPRDIVCAFNYSCCCLHTRPELVSYFKHARAALSNKGGIFVMDLYGGTSSEHTLKLQRKFPNFTVIFFLHLFLEVPRSFIIFLNGHRDVYTVRVGTSRIRYRPAKDED